MSNFTLKILLGSLLLTGLWGCASSGDHTAIGTVDQTTKPSSDAVRVSSEKTETSEPAVAIGRDNNIYVVYVEHAAENSADIYLQKFDRDMKLVGERVRIDPKAGTAKAWRGDQPTVQALQVSGKENVYVGWNLISDNSKDSGNDLVLSVSTDGGENFSAPVKVNDDTAVASHAMHGKALGENEVYFAWLDERSSKNEPQPKMKMADSDAKHEHVEPNAEIYFNVLGENGNLAGPNKKVAGEICPCCKVSMVTANDGRVYISWRQVLDGDFRHIAVTSTGDKGATFAEPVIVSDDKWQLNACPVSGAPMAVSEDGTLRIAWYTAGAAGPAGLYWAESKDQGKTFSPRALVSEGVVLGTPVIFSDRVIWAANGKILAKKISGTPADDKPLELADGELPSAAAAGGFIYLAYVKNENGKKTVWLQRSAN